jgi:hypothetical protein
MLMPMKTRVLTLAALAASALTGFAADFTDELAFLKKHTEVVLLTDSSSGAKVAIAPAWQGRVMTSTAGGENALSFGWVNRELITSGKPTPHINVFGGEDRFWMGPEGGQFSIFFAPGVPFDFEHWSTPAAIDTEPFETVKASASSATFRRAVQLQNYSKTALSVEVTREVRLLSRKELRSRFGDLPKTGAQVVAFESVNTVKNTGSAAWTKDSGMLSIWILGMFNASPASAVVVPFKPGPVAELGPIVNDTYFGKVPADRLQVGENVLFFRADAACRSKIGLNWRRAKPVLGSYDAANHVLTLVSFTLPKEPAPYVNSMWELQKDPFAGDTVNSYNDGPAQPGAKQMGQFYELESSSPALPLAPQASATHVHTTAHFQGKESDLNKLAEAALGVDLATVAAWAKGK